MTPTVDNAAVSWMQRLNDCMTFVSERGFLSPGHMATYGGPIGELTVLEYCILRGLPAHDCYTMALGRATTHYTRVTCGRTPAHDGYAMSTKTGQWLRVNRYRPAELAAAECGYTLAESCGPGCACRLVAFLR